MVRDHITSTYADKLPPGSNDDANCKGYKPTIDVWIMQACFDHKCVPDKQNTAPTTREFQKIIIGTQKWPPA